MQTGGLPLDLFANFKNHKEWLHSQGIREADVSLVRLVDVSQIISYKNSIASKAVVRSAVERLVNQALSGEVHYKRDATELKPNVVFSEFVAHELLSVVRECLLNFVVTGLAYFSVKDVRFVYKKTPKRKKPKAKKRDSEEDTEEYSTSGESEDDEEEYESQKSSYERIATVPKVLGSIYSVYDSKQCIQRFFAVERRDFDGGSAPGANAIDLDCYVMGGFGCDPNPETGALSSPMTSVFHSILREEANDRCYEFSLLRQLNPKIYLEQPSEIDPTQRNKEPEGFGGVMGSDRTREVSDAEIAAAYERNLNSITFYHKEYEKLNEAPGEKTTFNLLPEVLKPGCKLSFAPPPHAPGDYLAIKHLMQEEQKTAFGQGQMSSARASDIKGVGSLMMAEARFVETVQAYKKHANFMLTALFRALYAQKKEEEVFTQIFEGSLRFLKRAREADWTLAYSLEIDMVVVTSEMAARREEENDARDARERELTLLHKFKMEEMAAASKQQLALQSAEQEHEMKREASARKYEAEEATKAARAEKRRSETSEGDEPRARKRASDK